MTRFIRRLLPFVRPYRARFLGGLFCGLLFAAFNGLLVVEIKLVVNLVFSAGHQVSVAEQLKGVPSWLHPLTDGLVRAMPVLHSPDSSAGAVMLILLIPLTMLLRGLFGYLNVYLISWSAVRAIAHLRTTLFDHLQNLSLSFFNQARTGDLISRITSDTQILYGVVGNSFASSVKDPFTILVLVIVFLTQQPRLTLISLIVLPICLVPITIYSAKVRRSAKAMQGHVSELTSLMHEAFTGNRVIKAYNLEGHILNQFKATTGKYVNHMMRVIRANEIPSQITEFLGSVGVALVLIYAFFSGHGNTSGDFVSFVIGIVLMYQPIKSLTKLHNQLHQASSASERVFELLDTTVTVADPPNPVPLRAQGADIHFDNVSFAYGDRKVLQDINLTVKAGQMVALVGKSGSGKTTLANLLLRFYDPQPGAVCIGGTDIRQVAIKDLRRQVALVAQETVLFNDTIRGNIAVGKSGCSAAEIEQAARFAYAHDFIREKESGYETMVGEKGIALSGGQRQRIAIARAILKDAPILILDEATSALDSESERAFQQALEKLMEGRTTICIAHRLSTIQKADLIVVLDQGRIVEIGTHAELVERRGVYGRLHELQFEVAEA